MGYNTTDEMFIIYFHYMNYLPGDENYDLKGTLVTTLSQADAVNPTTLFWKGNNQNGTESTAGMYYLSINNKGKMSTAKIIKR